MLNGLLKLNIILKSKGADNMKKYFIKGFFSDWREVSQEEYDKFVEHLIQNSPMPNNEKIVSFHTKVEEN